MMPFGGGQHDTSSYSNGNESDPSSRTLGPVIPGHPSPKSYPAMSSSGAASVDMQSPGTKSKFLMTPVDLEFVQVSHL